MHVMGDAVMIDARLFLNSRGNRVCTSTGAGFWQWRKAVLCEIAGTPPQVCVMLIQGCKRTISRTSNVRRSFALFTLQPVTC